MWAASPSRATPVTPKRSPRSDHRVDYAYRSSVRTLKRRGRRNRRGVWPQARAAAAERVIGVLNEVAGPRDVIICAAGSLPASFTSCGARATRRSTTSSYGYSCMGYEIPGASGVKLAGPNAM